VQDAARRRGGSVYTLALINTSLLPNNFWKIFEKKMPIRVHGAASL
jgi:hypothetical protein